MRGKERDDYVPSEKGREEVVEDHLLKAHYKFIGRGKESPQSERGKKLVPLKVSGEGPRETAAAQKVVFPLHGEREQKERKECSVGQSRGRGWFPTPVSLSRNREEKHWLSGGKGALPRSGRRGRGYMMLAIPCRQGTFFFRT